MDATKQIANEHQFVQVQVGFVEVPATAFEKQWNREIPIMKPISGVNGPCDVEKLISILDDEMRKHWKGVADGSNYKEAYIEQFGRIAIAKSLDGGKRFAIGVLEYDVVSLEKWEK